MRRKPLVLSHWYKAFEDFQISPRDFYVAVEEAVKRREIPGLRMEHIMWQEGGALSASREYLRINRGRVNFDLCAAPFGTGFFFSSWAAHVPPRGLSMVCFIGTVLGSWASFVFLVSAGLPYFGAISLIVGALFILAALIQAGIFGNEEVVLWMPLLGRVYERLFNPDTYFKHDAETVFWEFVHAAVMETIEAETTVKGIRGLTDEERQPTLGGQVTGQESPLGGRLQKPISTAMNVSGPEGLV